MFDVETRIWSKFCTDLKCLFALSCMPDEIFFSWIIAKPVTVDHEEERWYCQVSYALLVGIRTSHLRGVQVDFSFKVSYLSGIEVPRPLSVDDYAHKR